LDFAQINYNKNKINNNFDFILFLDGSNYHEYLKFNQLYPEITFGIPRFDKTIQTLYLDKFNIKHPYTFFSNTELLSTNSISYNLKDYTDKDMFVLKIVEGARGLGQALLNKRQLIDLCECDDTELNLLKNYINTSCAKLEHKLEIKKTDDIENYIEKHSLKEKYDEYLKGKEEYIKIDPNYKSETEIKENLKSIKFSQNELHDYLLNGIKNCGNHNSIIIQEYLDYREEWRILWFYGLDPIIIKRNKAKDNWQVNACNNKDNISFLDTLSYSRLQNILKDINNMCIALKTPFMSIDVYHDKSKDEYGVFEFQMEFG
jgi:hypothetical protein